MTEHRFIDAVQIGKPRKTVDGYLTARVWAARTGLMDYTGAELGRPDLDIVRLYRPEDEVFNKDSLGSFKGKPITDGHPKERVTKDNHTALQRGHISGVARDGEAVALDVAITDGSMVASLEGDGARELSAGYVSQIDWTPGETPDGQHYDAVQRGIFVDHLAIVPKGRAGSEFRIGDGVDAWGVSPLATPPSKHKEDTMSDALISVVLGDKAVNVPAAQAPAIEAFKDAAAKTLADTIATKDAEIATLKKSVETKDGELTAAKKSLEDATAPAALADMAKKRAKTTEAGKAAGMAETDMDKMDDAAIRRAVVAKSIGDEAAKAMTDDAIDGAFAFANANPTRTADDALGGGIRTQDADSWAFLDKKEA